MKVVTMWHVQQNFSMKRVHVIHCLAKVLYCSSVFEPLPSSQLPQTLQRVRCNLQVIVTICATYPTTSKP
jgi:hypothetical protein